MQTTVTVLEPARSHDLTVLATLKAELNIKASDRSKDARLIGLIKQATGRINKECGRPFGSERVSQTFWLADSECASVLVLQRRPVVGSVESVTEGDSATALESQYYELRSPEHGFLARATSSSNSWPSSSWQSGKVVVVYTGGYDLLGALPEDLERACLDLAVHYYHSGGRDPMVTSVDIADVGSRSYAQPSDGEQLPQSVKGLLRPYRKVA